jgi:hypothetical protein
MDDSEYVAHSALVAPFQGSLPHEKSLLRKFVCPPPCLYNFLLIQQPMRSEFLRKDMRQL